MSYLLAFGQELYRPNLEDENKVRELMRMRNISYRIGFTISKLQQKYAISGVTLIDNETFAFSLKKRTSGVNDIVDLYLLHTVKTIAHRFSKIIMNHEMGIVDSLWHELFKVP